jgi:hypothetical protein
VFAVGRASATFAFSTLFTDGNARITAWFTFVGFTDFAAAFNFDMFDVLI